MKIGELLLNWQKEPVGVYLGDNNVFYIKNQKTHSYNNKQMLAYFYQEGGLEGADLESAILSDANLKGVNFKGANLKDANLSYTDLTGANLEGADLRSANLRSANLTGANLKGVIYSQNTIWPVGFDKSRLLLARLSS